eukprot:2918303-Rhodomonas_salina.2
MVKRNCFAENVGAVGSVNTTTDATYVYNVVAISSVYTIALKTNVYSVVVPLSVSTNASAATALTVVAVRSVNTKEYVADAFYAKVLRSVNTTLDALAVNIVSENLPGSVNTTSSVRTAVYASRMSSWSNLRPSAFLWSILRPSVFLRPRRNRLNTSSWPMRSNPVPVTWVTRFPLNLYQ